MRIDSQYWSAHQFLTHIILAVFLCDIGKQCRPRSDAAKRGVLSGYPLFLTECTRKILIGLKHASQQPLNSKYIDSSN